MSTSRSFFLEAAYVEIVCTNISDKFFLFFCLRETSYVKHADGKASVIYWLHSKYFKCLCYQFLTVDNWSSHYLLLINNFYEDKIVSVMVLFITNSSSELKMLFCLFKLYLSSDLNLIQYTN